jgi:hypothetical protein
MHIFISKVVNQMRIYNFNELFKNEYWLGINRKMIGEAIYLRVCDRKYNPIATKRGNVLTRSCRSKSAVFRMHSSLTSHGYSNITARFCLRSYDSSICFPFFKHFSRDYEKTTITAMYHGRWFAYKQTNKYLYCQSYTPVKALEKQIRCFPYVLPSDVERLQQLYKCR